MTVVACEVCGKETPGTATGRCNNCWEVESRLTQYVAAPAARGHLLRLLATYGENTVSGASVGWALLWFALGGFSVLTVLFVLAVQP